MRNALFERFEASMNLYVSKCIYKIIKWRRNYNEAKI